MSFTPRIKLFATLPTTMLEARSQVRSGEPEGTTIMARAQTSGRGRLGRSWVSDSNAGIYATLILKPPVARKEQFGELSIVSGIAIAETMRSLGVSQAQLKWPNDVLVGTRKLAGILLESDLTAQEPFVLVGMGINFTKRDDRQLPDDIADLYTGLYDHVAEVPAADGRDALASTLHTTLHWIAKRYEQWLTSGLEPLLSAYADLDALRGQAVSVKIRDGEALTGTADGINAHGELVVQTATGPTTVRSGEVERVTR